MKVKTIKLMSAEKENFKLFKLKDDVTCKLEFTNNPMDGYSVKYCENDLGTYSTDNLDLLILNFLQELAIYNNGNSKDVKSKLNNLIENKSIITNQQYPTIYKNSVLKYLLGLEDNIIRAASIGQNLTYQQLADAIGVSESSLRSSVSTNKVSKQVEKSIEMYLKVLRLEKELEKANTIKAVLKSWLE